MYTCIYFGIVNKYFIWKMEQILFFILLLSFYELVYYLSMYMAI